MAAPVYQAKGTLGETGLNIVSFTYPALAANDLLYLLVYNQSYTTITTTVGWTLQNSLRTSNGFGMINLYAKVSTGSESGSENLTRPTGSEGTFAAQVYSFRGDAFITIESGRPAKGSSDTITWGAVSVGGSERVLGAFVVNINGPNPGTPATYSNKASDVLTDGTYFELNTKDNVSSDGSVTATGGSLDEWGTFHHSIYNNTPAITTPSTFIVN
jgi:hypothetical protein